MILSIGFTGTRKGMTDNQKEAFENLIGFLIKNSAIKFHHGDCIGADEEAHKIVQKFGCQIVIHPPVAWEYRAYCEGINVIKLPAKTYLHRNHDIVDICDQLIACPKQDKMPTNHRKGGGTWATVRYAIKKGKEIKILPPFEHYQAKDLYNLYKKYDRKGLFKNNDKKNI